MPQASIRIEPVLPTDLDFIQTHGDQVLREIKQVLQSRIGPMLANAFEDRATGWKDSPNFEQKFSETTDQMVMAVTPQGKNRKIWIYVSGGTKSHMIYNRKRTSKGHGLYIKGGVGGYSPRTRPGNVFGGSGTYNMSASFRAFAVHHPGIQPREFEKHIVEDEQDDLVSEITQVVEKLAAL